MSPFWNQQKRCYIKKSTITGVLYFSVFDNYHQIWQSLAMATVTPPPFFIVLTFTTFIQLQGKFTLVYHGFFVFVSKSGTYVLPSPYQYFCAFFLGWRMVFVCVSSFAFCIGILMICLKTPQDRNVSIFFCLVPNQILSWSQCLIPILLILILKWKAW